MKLYEISQEYREFLEMYEDGGIPEDVFEDTLDSIDSEFNKKIDCVSCYIKELSAEEREIKREIDVLSKRKAAKKNTGEKLKEYVKNHMLSVGKLKIETSRNKIQIRKNPASVAFDDDFILWAKENAKHFLNFKAPEADKIKLKEALKSGEEIPHAQLIQTERVEIK